MTKNKSTYRTIHSLSTGLYKEKGSKFIGLAVPCYSEEEAKEFLTNWRKEHHQARHVCYAYRLGREMKKYRANDDGEPGNSAGPPILGQIKAYSLTNVLIAVVRYYGGTKLGVGGLINAYKTAAKEAIESSKIVEKEVFAHLQLNFNYEAMPAVMQLLKKHNLEMESNEFALDCTLVANVRLQDKESIVSELNLINNVEIKDLGIY